MFYYANAVLSAYGYKVGERIISSKAKDRPSKVIFCVLTDGEENASKEYSTKQIKELIEYRKKHFEWDFIFLAANQDAFETSKQYSFDTNKTFSFEATVSGVHDAYRSMNLCATTIRTK